MFSRRQHLHQNRPILFREFDSYLRMVDFERFDYSFLWITLNWWDRCLTLSHLLSSDSDQMASLKPSMFIRVFVCFWIKCSLWIDLKSANFFPRFIVQYVTGPCRCSVILPANTDTCGLQFLCSSGPSLWQNWCEHCNCQLDQFHCQQLLLAKNTILFQP